MRMKRRDFVKVFAALPIAVKSLVTGNLAQAQSNTQPQAASTISTNPVAHFDYRTQMDPSTVPDVVAATRSSFFTPSQMAALRHLGDLFMPPADGYPGAAQAGTIEFLDFHVGASPAARKKLYRDGLDRLNADSSKQFGVPFAKTTAAQADKLLKPWLRAWISDHPPTEPYPRFLSLAQVDIRTATTNSQAWSLAATSSGERAPGVGLYWSPVDPDIHKSY